MGQHHQTSEFRLFLGSLIASKTKSQKVVEQSRSDYTTVPEKKTRHLGSSQMGWTINYKHLSI
jgi:hypothetical protein